VSRLAPSRFWTFSNALFEHQAEFFDEPCADEAPSKTRIRLADLAVKSAGVDKYQFLDLVTTGKGNGGSKVTNDLVRARLRLRADAPQKLQIKLGRQNGIHVTPTAVLDGLIDGSVSSSFDTDDCPCFVAASPSDSARARMAQEAELTAWATPVDADPPRWGISTCSALSRCIRRLGRCACADLCARLRTRWTRRRHAPRRRVHTTALARPSAT